MKDPRTEVPPLSQAGRRLADAQMEAAKFKPTVDGKRLVRRFEVHGMEVTEWVVVDDAASADEPVP